MYRILRREEVDVHMLGDFFKVVNQLVLLFDSERWVVIPSVGRTLGVFHHRGACSLTVKKHQRLPDGILEYPPPPLWGRRRWGQDWKRWRYKLLIDITQLHNTS